MCVCVRLYVFLYVRARPRVCLRVFVFMWMCAWEVKRGEGGIYNVAAYPFFPRQSSGRSVLSPSALGISRPGRERMEHPGALMWNSLCHPMQLRGVPWDEGELTCLYG